MTQTGKVPPDFIPPAPTMEREARPGETCSCGRPAVVVYITERFGEVPWCGRYNDVA